MTFDTSTPAQSATPVEGRRRPPRRRRRTETRPHESRAGSWWRCCSPGYAPAAHAQIPLPQLEARVTDLTGTLTAAQQSALEDKLAAFEARKGAQIAVLILPTTEPEDIAQFGVRLAEAWKLGRKGVDDGADRSSSPRTIARCASKCSTASKARSPMRSRAASSMKPSCRCSSRAISTAASMPVSTRCSRVIDGEPLPAPDQALEAGERRRHSLPELLRCR